eukprot:scaffold20264_cov119-Isochrysis_galbana.AAC.3
MAPQVLLQIAVAAALALPSALPARGGAVRRLPSGLRLSASDGVTVQIERVDSSQARMHFSLSADTTSAALEEVGRGEQAITDALSLLLQRDVPSSLLEALYQDGTVRLLGQARLSGESPEELLARFKPGAPLTLCMEADTWPNLPAVSRKDYYGLTLRLPRREVDAYHRKEALLELRKRYVQDDGTLPELDDALAEQVSAGLTADELSELIEERIKREAAIAESGAVFEVRPNRGGKDLVTCASSAALPRLSPGHSLAWSLLHATLLLLPVAKFSPRVIAQHTSLVL